ncbi:thioester domain-containing protein [Bacillus inaquosorum]|uniref:thioester domain-containing protein n=1 Tax=Bacillus inaquosorum TaxID=483913 RepID=UPI002282F6C6|nr:thioester domain-containing protein [Bacillus inaquosorum]MCY8056466.1 hypothetical protein [Bacillus inaquosorum]
MFKMNGLMTKRIAFSFFCLVSIILSGIIFTGNVDAASPKVEYLGKVRYGDYIVGKFKVNGEIAFCVDHVKETPPTGASYGGGNAYKNEKIRAILYYGYGGPGNEVGNGDTALVATSIALDTVMNGNHSSGRESIPGYKKLMQHAEAKDAPSTSIEFNKTNVTSKVSGNVQKSETIVFKADSKNSIKLNVPDKVTLHTGGKEYSGKTVTIKGGQSFYLTAPLDYGNDVKFHNVKPSLGKYQSLLFTAYSSSYQRLGSGLLTDPEPVTDLNIKFEVRQKKINVQHIDKYTKKVLEEEHYTRNIGTDYSFKPKNSIEQGGNKYIPVDKKSKKGTVGNKDVTVKFYYNLQRKVTIKHVDARDNRVIKTESDLYVRGDKYSYKPRNDLKKGDYTYRPTSNKVLKGEIGSKNITLTFYYDVPLIKANLKKIQIYTQKSVEGLPVKLYLDRVNVYPDDVNDMSKEKIKVSIYDGKKVVVSKEYTAKSLPTKSEMKIPAADLVVNKKKTYTVKLEGYSKYAFDVDSKKASLSTDGYTASEKTIKVSSDKENNLSYKGVVMTEREVGKNMKLFYESLNIPLKSLSKMRTGYGFDMPVNFSYSNDIGTWAGDFGVDMLVPTTIVDSSYIQYPTKKKVATVSLEKTSSAKTKNGESVLIKSLYELQHVNVEKRTGHLFTDDQVKKKDKRIKYELIDGNRKFYLPIWGNIGDYTVKVQSNEPIGVNQVNFEVNNSLNVFAHMIAHMDSETVSDDAILIKPVSPDNPFPEGLPKGWTQSDVKWINK